MLASERVQFAKHVEALCAGFNVPATEARIDAYWRGCHAMPLLAFERTVDFAVGPECDEDELPSPKRMHYLQRRMLGLRRAAEAAARPAAASEPERDVFDAYSNRVLLLYLNAKARRCGAAASEGSLRAMVECKNRYAASYREMCASEPEASLDLRDALIDSLEQLYQPAATNAVPRTCSDEAWMPLALVALR